MLNIFKLSFFFSRSVSIKSKYYSRKFKWRNKDYNWWNWICNKPIRWRKLGVPDIRDRGSGMQSTEGWNNGSPNFMCNWVSYTGRERNGEGRFSSQTRIISLFKIALKVNAVIQVYWDPLINFSNECWLWYESLRYM